MIPSLSSEIAINKCVNREMGNGMTTSIPSLKIQCLRAGKGGAHE